MASAPIHPGEVLALQFMYPAGMVPEDVAERSGIPLARVLALLHGDRSVTDDDAIGLHLCFCHSDDASGSSAFWLNIQAAYDRDTRRTLVPSVARARLAYGAGVVAGVFESWRAYRLCGAVYGAGDRFHADHCADGFTRGQQIRVPFAWWR